MGSGKKFEVSRKNILAHELIGLWAEVRDSTDKKRKGLNGMIVDETKNTLRMEIGETEKVLPKKECVFGFRLPDNSIAEVNGKKLCFRPEDRIKEYWRKAI